jgi:hypothetical protein
MIPFFRILGGNVLSEKLLGRNGDGGQGLFKRLGLVRGIIHLPIMWLRRGWGLVTFQVMRISIILLDIGIRSRGAENRAGIGMVGLYFDDRSIVRAPDLLIILSDLMRHICGS